MRTDGKSSHTKYSVDGSCHNASTASKVCHGWPLFTPPAPLTIISFAYLHVRIGKGLQASLKGKSLSIFFTVHAISFLHSYGCLISSTWKSLSLACCQPPAHNFKTTKGPASPYVVSTSSRVITCSCAFLPHRI